MPLLQALYLLAAVAALAVLGASRRLHPLLALAGVALAFGYAAGMGTAQLGRAFGNGFAQAVNTTGLAVIAGAIIATVAERTGAGARLAAWATAWARRRGTPPAMAILGLVAGLAASPAAAFAALAAWREAAGWSARGGAVLAAVGLALALVAGHGLILPAPGPIAGVAILEAPPLRVLALGAPVAIVAAAAGAAWLALAGRRIALPEDPARPIAPPTPRPHNLAAALLPVIAMLALLFVQALGQIASEPFGGGPARELLIGLGRPVMLLAAGVGLCLVLTWRWEAVVVSEDGWVGQAILRAAGLVLIVGAAGGFEKVLQETGMAELVAERLLTWQAGLLVPFLIALVMKTLQGSTLVAVITAAGMIVPALGLMGLDDPPGRAAAVIAVGAGAMAVSHVNDGYFWLVTGTSRLRVAAGLVLLSLGTLVQALAAMATLVVLAAIWPG